LSHGQAAAGDPVNMICFLLRQRGKTVWYDNQMSNRSTAAMEEGVKHSAHFLLFLSGDPELEPRLDAMAEHESEMNNIEVHNKKPVGCCRCCRHLQTLGKICIAVAVTLFVAGVVYEHFKDPVVPNPAKWNVSSEALEPQQGACPAQHYLAVDHDGKCHSCLDDCVAGQFCGRVGCFTCGAGTYDPDHNVLTPCVDCPGALTSGPEASTECTENPDDIWASLEWWVGILTALGCTPFAPDFWEWCSGGESNGNEEMTEAAATPADVENAVAVGRTRRLAGSGTAYTELQSHEQQSRART